ncbi:unnamed protein product [Cylindrotheca closterium]|uniref:CRAL-TRIO domain-containing protein n=1 Tax=Cylindrotheca closterium TaxID=2856 RepID=A0AAD2G4D1_9STRA|nr:unnamed protein product [Cylindrotheca closterium]
MTALMPRVFSLSQTKTSTKESLLSKTPTYGLIKDSIDAKRLRAERECIQGLRSYSDKFNIKISESLLFRFACFYDFDLKKAQSGIAHSRENEHYLNLKMNNDPGLKEFFGRRILFPLPGIVKTKTGHNMKAIYFCPARFFAADPTHCRYVIESLQYVLNDLSRSQQQSRTGVAVIINLAGHTNENFHRPTVAKFLGSLEGKFVPTTANLLIFVDAPPIFKPLMAFCKTVFSMNFAKKVHSIKSSKLSSFFMPGYEEYLPSELPGGWRDIEDDVDDYVDLKSYEDEMKTREEISWQE